jgi:hypothetical protein
VLAGRFYPTRRRSPSAPVGVSVASLHGTGQTSGCTPDSIEDETLIENNLSTEIQSALRLAQGRQLALPVYEGENAIAKGVARFELTQELIETLCHLHELLQKEGLFVVKKRYTPSFTPDGAFKFQGIAVDSEVFWFEGTGPNFGLVETKSMAFKDFVIETARWQRKGLTVPLASLSNDDVNMRENMVLSLAVAGVYKKSDIAAVIDVESFETQD